MLLILKKRFFIDLSLRNILSILCLLFFVTEVLSAPATVTFQARIVRPDLTNLESSNVSFKFYYLYPKPAGTDLQCVIYAEEITGVNMTGSKGLVTLQLGSGTRTYGSGNLKNVFDNSTPSYACQAGGTYTPAATDNRRIIVQFNDGTGVQTLPPSDLSAVPYAMQSYNSQRLGNSLATDFLKFTDFTGTCAAGEYLKYDSTASPKFSCATPVGGGSGIVNSVTPGTGPLLVGGTAADPTISIPQASAIADGYLSSADFTTFNSKLSNFSTLTSSDISAKYGYVPASPSDSRFTDPRTPTDGSVTAAKIASATITFDKFNQSSATTGQVIKWNGSAWVASSDDTGVGAVTSVAGRTGVVTLSSGDISGLAFGTTAGTFAQGNDSRFTDTRTPTDNSVTSAKIVDGTITSADISDASIEANKLAQMGASSGQVLKWNGSVWVASSDLSNGGTVTTVTASGPLSSSGGATPNISLSQANGTTDGYLSSADFTTFAAKLSDFSTLLSSDITSKLGYTPVNPTMAVTSVAGRIGVVTLSSGDISGLAFGTTAGTYAQGNDSRFTDTRTPTDNSVTSAKILDGTIAAADLSSMDASVGQVMKWNGSAWVASSDLSNGGTVTTVTASGPLSSSGGATPNISLSQANGTTDGYLSSADFTTFAAKLSDFSTLLSSDITSKLGYTPVNPSTLGSAALLNSSQVVLVSNMPANCNAGQALTFSSPTGSWVCSNIVLNSSSVTSAMITSLDWTKVVNTPTTAAGYGIPKATAAADGYLSSADFTTFSNKLANFSTMTSMDVTTAIGYTAANSSDVSGKVSKSGDTMTGALNLPSNGLAVGTNQLVVSGGNVGIGTATPVTKLDVAGTLHLNMDPADNNYNVLSLHDTHIATNQRYFTGLFNNISAGNLTYTSANGAMTFRFSDNASYPLRFYSQNWNGTSYDLTERMRINGSNGNVGIGTPSPSTQLANTATNPTDAAGLGISATGLAWLSNAAGYTATFTNTDATATYRNTVLMKTAATDTGSHVLKVESGGLNRFSVRADGNVGIGTATPTHILEVMQNSATAGLAIARVGFTTATFNVSNNGTSDILGIGNDSSKYKITLNQTNGNVGIGTTTPTAKLTISSSDGTAATAPLKFIAGTNLSTPENGAMEFDGTDLYFTSAGTRRTIASSSGGALDGNVSAINNSGGSITMTPSAGNSVIVNQTTTSTNSTSGALIVNGGVGIAENLNVGGNIVGSGAITAQTSMLSPLIYGSSVSSGDLTLDSTSHGTKGNIILAPTGGKVGIGTTAPLNKIHTHESSDIASLMQFTNSDTGQLNSLTGVRFGLSGDEYAAVASGSNANGVRLYTSNSIRMTVDNTGNVGIGTVSPVVKLEVLGSGSGASVATSGSSDATMNFRASRGTVGVDIGMLDNGTGYLQNRNIANFATNYNFSIQPNGGSVGVGTISPRATLDVTGVIVSRASQSFAAGTIDFSVSNLRHTTQNCGAFALHNLKDGGTYMFAVQGTTVATCSFTAFSDAGSTALTVHMPPDHAATTTGKHTIYNIAVMGTHAYIAWTPGY